MKKHITVALAALLAFTLASCTDEYQYTPASLSTGNAYLDDSLERQVFVADTMAQSFSITVGRIDSTKAETIRLTSSNSKFTLPSEVAFAAGERTKQVPVSFSLDVFGRDTVDIAVAADNRYEYKGSLESRFIVSRYKGRKGREQSALGGFDIETSIYQLDSVTYVIPGSSAGWTYDFRFTIHSDSTVVVPVQPFFIHTRGTVYGIGNASSDASLTATGLTGTGLAGLYDPSTKTANLTLLFAIPGVGRFGNRAEVITFSD